VLALDVIISFLGVSIVLALSPGPDNIFVLTQSVLNGRRAGYVITLGLCTGLVFHTLLVAVGVATIIQDSQWLFSLVKFVGVGYLLYLAYLAFRASGALSLDEVEGLSCGQLYRRGIMMNITNPKVSLFFLAFFPQFAHLDRGPLLPQILALGGIFMLSTFVVFCSIALLAGYLSTFFKKSSGRFNMLNKIAGTVFVGLAIKLVVVER